jgi:ubiquinone/menaquinone biosynthesis C-methylase UbiE
VLDLSCGTAHLARSLAQRPGIGPVIGIDLSLPMLEEAHHHLSERGTAVDLIRADASQLPLADASMGAVLNAASFHLYDQPELVLQEVRRVLTPGGHFVCSTVLPGFPHTLDKVERRAGIRRRDEKELRRLFADTGLHSFERVVLQPWIVIRALR